MWDDWPGTEQGLALHRRLAAGDPVAPSEFAAAYLDLLVNFLRGVEPHCDNHTLMTAAEDAVLSVIRNPRICDPARGQLGAFLRMAAKADLANALEAERRHRRRREDRDCVELPADGRNNPVSGADDLPSFDDPDFATVIAGLSDTERRVFDLMRNGERRTAAAAAVLGIEHLSADEQARQVKRVKERIFKRLRRTSGNS